MDTMHACDCTGCMHIVLENHMLRNQHGLNRHPDGNPGAGI